MINFFVQVNQSPGGPYQPGMVIGNKFVLLQPVSAGSMSVIYEARDVVVQRRVAIKLLQPEYVRNPDIISRLRREAEAIASLQHPNVVAVFEIGQLDEGCPFIVQELLLGATLREHLYERERLTPTEALDIMIPVMGALVAAHRNSIIHRDVKPENIILARSSSGEVVPKLIDFGVAKIDSVNSSSNLTRVGDIIGTPSYMSPEQARGMHPLDARTDVWATGVVLFELLTGVCPYEVPHPYSATASIDLGEAPRIEGFQPAIPTELADIVHRALEREAGMRFRTMQAFRDALADFYRRSLAPQLPSHQVRLRSAPPCGDTLVSSFDAALPSVRCPAPPSSAVGDRLSYDDLSPSIPPSPPSPPSGARSGPRPILRPSLTGEGPWGHGEAPLSPQQGSLAAAERALAMNRLHDAITLADEALGTGSASVELAGRMYLVQAIAHRWLGNFVLAEQCAVLAADRLSRGSGGWYTAVGYAAIAAGHQGNHQRLMACLEEAGKIEVTPEKVNLHAILLCRLAIFLLRVGLPALAHGLYAEAKRLIAGQAVALVTQAWCEAARAEVALQKGDVAAHLRCAEASVTSFTGAGDLRNACVGRARVGKGYMQFGAYRRAVAVLEELLRVAEPMRHEVAVQAKVSLGMALAHLEKLDQALEVESAALKDCLEQGDRALAGRARTYLATILLMRGDIRSAEHVARQALESLGDKTAGRALALGTLASIKLAESQPALALGYSREAAELVGRLGGLEEGEPMISAAYALSLRAAGREAEAREVITAARARLLERADRIRDPEWRARFLGAVPENARVVDLAMHWEEAIQA